MLSFFKRIRRSLLSTGNIRTYIPYALGEILLVVIGILIALEINNWNQDLIERKKEKVLLEEIHSEFLYNKKELDINVRDYRRVLTRCNKIVALFPIDVENINLDTLGQHLRWIDFNGSFDMSRSSMQSIKSTYSFDIISNQELRTLLLRLDGLMEDYSEREARSIEFVNQNLLPYLQARIPFPFDVGLKDKRVDLSFLESIAFENLIRERIEKIRIFLSLVDNNDRPLVHSINRIGELSAQ